MRACMPRRNQRRAPSSRDPRGARVALSDRLSIKTFMNGALLTGMCASQHMPIDAVNGASVVVICNLVARKMGGIESQVRK